MEGRYFSQKQLINFAWVNKNTFNFQYSLKKFIYKDNDRQSYSICKHVVRRLFDEVIISRKTNHNKP